VNLDALVRSVTLRSENYMVFLGSGASITSGVPSAQDCVWRWKRLLYVTAHPKVNPVLLGSASLPHVQQKIQGWLDRSGGHPLLGSDEEYSYYADACFPRPEDRRAEFAQLSRDSRPHIGYRLLGLLTENRKIRWLWTTNFDDLLDRGRPDNRNRVLLQVGLDTTHRATALPLDGPETVQVFLHGDYRYDLLRNTASELQQLDGSLRQKLVEAVAMKPLLVVGYSGRDASVMDALIDAYGRKASDLYWCHMDGARLSPRVDRLIEVARSAGNTVTTVAFDGFDDLMERLARVWLTTASEQAAIERLLRVARAPRAKFSVGSLAVPDNNWLLGNAFEIELPRMIFEISGVSIPQEGAWKWLRAIALTHTLSAGLFKGVIIALGRQSDVVECFAALGGTVRQVEIRPEAFVSNSAVYAALLGAVVAAVRGSFRLAGRYVLTEVVEKTVAYSGKQYRYVEAVRLSLERAGERNFLALQLDIEVSDTLTDDDRKAVKREVLWQQRNFEYFQKLKGWKDALFPTADSLTFTFPPLQGDGARFRVDAAGPVVARVKATRPRPIDQSLARQMRRFERFTALEIEEPCLNFAAGKSIHPIRGLVASGPLDSNDPTLIGDKGVNVGVICTTGYEKGIQGLLASIARRHGVGPMEADRDYLVDYPGFESAFRCPLRHPSTSNDAHWRALPRIDAANDPDTAFGAIISAIRRAVDEVAADGQVDVVLVHVPPEWERAERTTSDGITRNLHDHIKALCIQRGVRTQLVREAKLALTHEARLNWWLALALYAKAMRSPWSLDHPARDVAYVGIGYSYTAESYRDPIVLGCSHVFDSTGLGLRFRLGKLKEPIWRAMDHSGRRTPFMSRDDAALLGNRTRQLFYEIHQRLPERVLVTKRTPFLRSEREGILAALADVPQVDLVTVETDDSWRFCAYNARTKRAHGFPTRRGSAVVLDDDRFLLWLHGSVMEVLPDGKTYYQGKSRIPTPVRATRFAGTSDLDTLATDLLALTKMDWNTFALYKKMPVTVTSPNVIARIGRLLSSTTAESYDYRLFM
jgi:hypothetical protein